MRAVSSGKLPSAAIWPGTRTVLNRLRPKARSSSFPVSRAKAATCMTQQVPWLFFASRSSMPLGSVVIQRR